MPLTVKLGDRIIRMQHLLRVHTLGSGDLRSRTACKLHGFPHPLPLSVVLIWLGGWLLAAFCRTICCSRPLELASALGVSAVDGYRQNGGNTHRLTQFLTTGHLNLHITWGLKTICTSHVLSCLFILHFSFLLDRSPIRPILGIYTCCVLIVALLFTIESAWVLWRTGFSRGGVLYMHPAIE